MCVQVDDKIIWTNQLIYTPKCLQEAKVYLTWKFLDRKTLRDLYLSCFYPYLIYCVYVWGNSARLGSSTENCDFSKFDSHTELLEYEQLLLDIGKINHFVVGIFMSKYIHNDLHHACDSKLSKCKINLTERE